MVNQTSAADAAGPEVKLDQERIKVLAKRRQLNDLPRTGEFILSTDMQPTGDQPAAISELCRGIEAGYQGQTLLGVTGSGKTFTMANVIQRLQRPALVIAPNKTLAGQLCAEFMAFFPRNRVEYFVSYYDYYQPEAYIPSSDTYIEKDSAINDEIDRMRHSATASLLERRDVIVVASVSCIYGLGDPEDYAHMMVHLRPGMSKDRDEVIAELVSIQYTRNDFELKRGTFRVRGDSLDIWPASSEQLMLRVSFFGDEIERVAEMDRLTGKTVAVRNYVAVFPATHYATTDVKMKRAIASIEAELEQRLSELKAEGKLIEAYRLEQRTRYDLEMMRETGFTKGIENYSRHLDGRQPGEPPYTLLDFFPEDYLLFIDEAHVTVPQIGGMFRGDRARKSSLVDFGFRLPSAYDNRPLNFPEFQARMGQTVFVSATPGEYEKSHSSQVAQQIIRPTGLLDPEIAIHSVDGQIEDILTETAAVISRGERALILTLTKKMAEDLTVFLKNENLKVAYLHSAIANDERLKILRDLRHGKYDILVGINLLREGLDLPEVSLICILDADRQGFLRSTTSLIQIIGRAARNVNGKVIMYADEVTPQMLEAVTETNRRRAIQQAYNAEHHIIPQTIHKDIRDALDTLADAAAQEGLDHKIKTADSPDAKQALKQLKGSDLLRLADRLEKDMKAAAKKMDFEEAARLRDLWIDVKGKISQA
ncbi:excinuclease ABC subunit UvrB [Oscillospiraceae bacterium HV4-5-C5C]|nr:excinuclease ABC subunit UvrB [Oscillospiraceae bacterium HV4-5-C5C]